MPEILISELSWKKHSPDQCLLLSQSSGHAHLKKSRRCLGCAANHLASYTSSIKKTVKHGAKQNAPREGTLLLSLRAGQDEAQRRHDAEQQRKRREAQETDDEWGGSKPSAREQDWGKKDAVPRTEKYDLEPYDDDDYEPSGPPKSSKQASSGPAKVKTHPASSLLYTKHCFKSKSCIACQCCMKHGYRCQNTVMASPSSFLQARASDPFKLGLKAFW